VQTLCPCTSVSCGLPRAQLLSTSVVATSALWGHLVPGPAAVLGRQGVIEEQAGWQEMLVATVVPAAAAADPGRLLGMGEETVAD